MKNKTVITGMGVWSCLGPSITHAEESLRQGRCGLAHFPDLENHGYQSYNQGLVILPTDLDCEWLGNHRRTMSSISLWAAFAVREALQRSGLKDLSRAAIIVSNDSTACEQHEVEDVMRSRNDTRHLGPFRVFKCLNSTVSMNLAQVFGIGGLSLSVSAACAGGGHAIGLGHTLIKSGVADCVIVVGAQETGAYAFQAFDALGVFSCCKDAREACRPFDRNRTGLVPSGGAACVILESALHAANREAPNIEGCVEGYGFSTSPNIVTPSQQSIEYCMAEALVDAELQVDEIDLIAAHATGTRDGDRVEAEAIKHVFQTANVPVTATKALTGHECWMAGVSQVVYTLIQMHGHFIAPHPNYTVADPDMPSLNIKKDSKFDIDIQTALCNAFGFGGTNSSLVISKL